ncbi:hypothetical protein DH2020_032735 [Rehmannia glutinosa]|uniref:Protein kinase domain-containing protein n=1 Tax=Rehmannia glutinosa TaxID=99300 RepID=A0ABR0VEH5_REHGL
MVRQAMNSRWTVYGAQLSCLAFFILVLGIHGCCCPLNSEGFTLLQFRAKVNFDPSGALANWDSNDCNPCAWSGVHCLDGKVHMLDLSKNHLSGTIPPEFGQLKTLEVLDLRDNKLNGTVPAELGRLHSLKRLLLCNNGFEGSIPVEIGMLGLLTDLQCDKILTTVAAEVGCVNRKFGHCIWQSVLKQSQKSTPSSFKFGSQSSHDQADDSRSNLTGVIWNVDNRVNNVRRVLVEQSSNLAAIPPTPVQLEPVIALPSRSSGSFPAISYAKKLSPAPVLSPSRQESTNADTTNPGSVSQPNAGKSGNSVKLIVGLSVAVFLLMVAVAMCIVCRSRAARTIGPWKTGLSGQLQKAFVTGVPKLNRAELETACEDFSNIITTYDGVATVYKGTLSSGVEIAVTSTAIISIKDWSKRSAELVFRKKIDTLSRVNHKNFLNLIGYCEDDEPFSRMMVFEYAPNGTLFEHLHVKEVEHLDWNARMRIIMGTAYCLQHMHDLNPPMAHYNLTSKEILLTDDYAAKIGDISFWAELVAKSEKPAENESDDSELPPLADVETNVHSFGMLLLETISGKLPYSEDQGLLMNLVAKYSNDKKTVSNLIDPTLKTFKDNELVVVCEVAPDCEWDNNDKKALS